MRRKWQRNLLMMVVLVALLPAAGWAFPSMKKGNQPAAKADAALRGKVLETMNSGGYTYVLLQNDAQGKVWVATPPMAVKVGQEVALQPGIEMADFTSNTLKKTFSRIIFSGGPVKVGQPAGSNCPGGQNGKDCPQPKSKCQVAAGGMMAMGKPHGGVTTVPVAEIKVAKAQGPDAFTISELYARKDELANRKVRVRAQVVKATPNIMKRNWIHLQDGSGDPARGSFDLTVTSQELPQVGEIVVVEGELHVNKDFGAGYRYDLIIENARVKKDDARG